MPDKFGPRGVVAVAIPDQNSNMQPEYEAMRPAGISNQMYRFNIGIHDKVPEAVLSILPQMKGCWPDMVICGNSLEMRWWSVARQRQYRDEIRAVIPTFQPLPQPTPVFRRLRLSAPSGSRSSHR